MLEQLNEVIAGRVKEVLQFHLKGTPEEFDAATEILGAGAGIPKEQQIVNLASKLYAAKDSVGEPMYEENEIQERLKQFANTYDAYFAIDLGPQD